MSAALIKLNPQTIIKIFQYKPYNINIPELLLSASNVDIGYKTPDNQYQLVDVISFIIPNGKKIVENSKPSYSFNINNQVIETYSVEDLPTPPEPKPITIIIASDFISRFTDQEYSNIKKAALAQMQVDVATLQKWIDVATTDGYIDLDRPATMKAKAALVAAQLLTQERADIIFSISGE